MAQSSVKDTVVTKEQRYAQKYGVVLWNEGAAEVATGFPTPKWDKVLVDAMTVRIAASLKSCEGR